MAHDCDLGQSFKTERTSCAIRVVEDDGYAGPCDSCLTSLVNKILLILRSHRGHVRHPEDEAYRVENIRFPRAVEASDGVERGVPSRDLGPAWVRLET